MDNNIKQIDDVYKFKIYHIGLFFKDLFSNGDSVDDIELNKKIEILNNQQDMEYIQNLEKDVSTFVTKKISKIKNNRINNKSIKINSINKRNKEEEKDFEEKEL